MGAKPLETLDGDSLSLLLEEFGHKPKVFQSEAQFQFDLAWRLQDEYDCIVKLEDLTVVIDKVTVDKTSKQKIYTDITLEKDGYIIAIELKYKTAAMTQGNDILLFNHGASDLGRYDFLWDVNRLELLVIPTKEASEKAIAKEYTPQVSIDFPKLKHCNKGFAIILTNEDDYWKTSHENCKEGVIYKQFCIGGDSKTDKGQLYSTNLDWGKDVKTDTYTDAVANSSRARRLQLHEAYSYQWKDYCQVPTDNGKNGLFRYMIISITNSKI